MSGERKELKRVEITRPFVGLLYMQVCTVPDATDEEILLTCNYGNPSGTTAGWGKVMRVDEPDKGYKVGHCKDFPGRLHLLVQC